MSTQKGIWFLQYAKSIAISDSFDLFLLGQNVLRKNHEDIIYI